MSSPSPSENKSVSEETREADSSVSNVLSPPSSASSIDFNSILNDGESQPPMTVLDILRPQPWVPASTNEPKSEIAGVLEQLTIELIGIFRSQDWTNPLLECMVTNFSTYIDHNETRIKSVDAQIAYHQWMHRLNPGYDYTVESVSADVNEEKGTASVWALLCVTGHPQTIRRESMTVICWRRSKGKWRCYKQVGIRGVSWFT